jgi:membrane-bound serine protease (ClpP class)
MQLYRFTSLIPYLFFTLFFSVQIPAQENTLPSEDSSEHVQDQEIPELTPTYTDWDPIVANRGKRDWPENPKVYLIPVRQEIMHPQMFLIRRGVEQARKAKADAIILLMDTPGGRIDVMREIVNMIIDLDIPTYTFVEYENHGAISAGAIIAMSTDYIYMTPRASIGDAMPVVAGQGGYQTLGEAEREKIETYMDAMVRSVAQAKGRDEMMIRAMVRRNLEYVLENGRVISPKGSILTMTANEAARPRPNGDPLLSEGTVEDLDEMLELVGLGEADLIELEETWADGLALWITRLAPLLMGAAMICFYMELNSPGIGYMGGLAVLLFLIVTFGHNVAGLAGMEDVLFIVLGMILILAEILVIPGFGVAGISGIALLCVGMVKMMIVRYPGNPGTLPALENFGNVGPAFTNLGLTIIASFIGMIFVLRSMGENGFLGRRLVLADAVQPTGTDTLKNSLTQLVGKQGSAVTPLSPSGTVSIAGTEYDAVSDGVYLDAGTPVKVAKIQNYRILVTEVHASDKETS